MKKGDLVVLHHSNSNPPGVVCIATVNREGHQDPTAFDPKDAHFDPGSDPEKPHWIQVEIRFKRKFLDQLQTVVALAEARYGLKSPPSKVL